MTPALPEPGHPRAAYFFDLQGMLYPLWSAQGPWAARKLIELVKRIVVWRRPAYIAFAADLPFPTFRHELAAKTFPPDKLYKGDRKQLDPALKTQLLEQLRIAEELLADIFGIRTLKHRGAEADDILATLRDLALAHGIERVVIVANDRDLMQLVDEPHVVQWDGRDRVTGLEGVKKSLGVRPEQVVDYFAIVGGKNNIPGIPGLGKVAAVELLGRFASLKAAHEYMTKPVQLGTTDLMKKSWRLKLSEADEWARVSLILAQLDHALPLALGSFEELRALPFEDWEP